MMNFVLQSPSLQHLAGVKIVTHLWNQREVIARFNISMINNLDADKPEWLNVRDAVKSKVSALSLPEQCTKQLIIFVKPLGQEIIAWCCYHDEVPHSIQVRDVLLPNQLCWTMHGTIDYQKTAEVMVKDERLDVRRRFELACVYCLEVEARELFKKVAENRIQKRVPVLRYVNRNDFSQLVPLFARAIKLDVDDSMLVLGEPSRIKKLCKYTLLSGNRAMCEYLFQTLKPGEKEEVFAECLMRINSCRQFPTSNLLWYLSIMNDKQQRYMFEESTVILLECLIRWPTQSLFMEAVKCGWRFMDDRDCSQVLCAIVIPIIDGCNDYDYSQLFRECLSLSPANYQQFHWRHSEVLSNLSITKRVEFFRLIVKEAPLPLIEALCDRYHGMYRVVLDETVISDAALKECKDEASLNSANNQHDLELKLRSEIVRRLVNFVIACRIEERQYIARIKNLKRLYE